MYSVEILCITILNHSLMKIEYLDYADIFIYVTKIKEERYIYAS